MENREAIDQYLRSSLLEFEIQPRITSFDQVMQKLEKKRRRRFLIIFLAGFTALTVALLNFNTTVVTPKITSSHTGTNINSTADLRSSKPTADKSTAGGEKKISKNSSAKIKAVKKTSPALAVAPTLTEERLPVQAPHNDPPTLIAEDVAVAYESAETAGAEISELHYQKLSPVSMFLPCDTVNTEVEDQFTPPASAIVSSQKKKKHFFIGLHFSPQASYLHLMENSSRHNYYEGDGGKLAADYLQTRKDQNKIHLSYSFGLKFGMEVNDRWEFMAGLGFQKWRYEEERRPSTVPTIYYQTYAAAYSFATPPTAAPSGTFMNVFNYCSLSLETARIWQLRAITVKAGGGFALQYNLSANNKSEDLSSAYMYDYSAYETRKILVTPFLKAGIIEQLGSRLSFQVSPFIYYTPTSTFSKDYIIKQRFMGTGLEIALLLRL